MARSRRDSLRELARRFPGGDERDELLDNLSYQHDRSAAIIGAALLDRSLEHFIGRKMPEQNPLLLTRLFTNRGPLSDFDSKILVAAAFRLLSPTVANVFNSIKVVRNAFGHAAVDLSLGAKEIVDEMQVHIYPFFQKAHAGCLHSQKQNILHMTLANLYSPDPAEMKYAFCYTVQTSVNLLDNDNASDAFSEIETTSP